MQLGEKEGRGVCLGSLYKDSLMQGPQTTGLQHSLMLQEFLSATMIGMKTVISELQSDTIAIQRTGKPRNIRGDIIFFSYFAQVEPKIFLRG